jgi:hypothetical protein
MVKSNFVSNNPDIKCLRVFLGEIEHEIDKQSILDGKSDACKSSINWAVNIIAVNLCLQVCGCESCLEFVDVTTKALTANQDKYSN